MFSILFALCLLILGTTLLFFGADWFLDGTSDLARLLKVSTLVLGVLLAGLEPEEMLTAAIASARGAPDLAVGNIIGTNITISTVALGLSALVFPLSINRNVRRQALITTLISIVPVALLLSGSINQLEGLFLLLVFIGSTIFLILTDREAFNHLIKSENDDDDNQKFPTTRLHLKPLLLTFGGLATMSIGGPAIVEGALRLAGSLGLSMGIVGATIVSLGTGAEIIALGISAARKKQSEVLVGGILGSFAYNLLVTLGLAASIHSITVDTHLTIVGLSTMIGVHLLLLALVWSGKITRVMGGALVAMYIAYLAIVVLI